MASHAVRGKKALDNKDYEEAITAYSAAIQESPTSADYFIQRSTAYQRSQRNAEALSDADQAVLNAQARDKLELIIEAQFRRGIALFSLGRYADAKFVLDFVKRKNEKHKMADMWIGKTDLKLKSLPEDDISRKLTVTDTPSPLIATPMKASTTKTENPSRDSAPVSVAKSQPVTSQSPASDTKTATPQSQQTPADKIRYDWYENKTSVFFTLLTKGVPEGAEIDITERSLSISFPTETGATYDLSLDPLFAKIDPQKSTKRILPSKVEVTLVKVVAGQKWSALESSAPIEPPREDAPVNSPIPQSVSSPPPTAVKESGPSYPTSSKSGPKNWDNIVDDLADGKGKDGDDGDDEGPDAFFKKLFKGANPDMQRAMMKSYTESNGTSLSTNWDEVSKGPVETLPPDGMEARRW